MITTSQPTSSRRTADLGSAVHVEHVTKRYGTAEHATTALDDVSITFRTGRFTAIMGPSGCGKSTLLHVASGLDVPTAGRVEIGATDLSTLDDVGLTRLRRDHVGFVFQRFNLLPTLTAVENIGLPARLAGRRPDARWLDVLVDTVGLTGQRHHRPDQLSGGQQQRVAVARALINVPAVLFADEPTGNLDSRAGDDVLTLLRRAADDLGQTIIMVTHDPVAACRADRVVFMVDGRIVDDLHAPDIGAVLARTARPTVAS